jgi:hypothetical protein
VRIGLLTNRIIKIVANNRHFIFWLLFVTGIILRSLAAQGELWLDEVWNIQAIRNLHSPLEVYTSPNKMDGHSSIFSILLFFLPSHATDLVYRTPSLLFSFITLIVIFANSTQDIKLRLLTLTLFCYSYLLILYGTEARGYSGMLMFLALAHTSFEKIARKNATNIDLALFATATCLGFLFHYSIIIWFFGVILAFLLTTIIDRQIIKTKTALTLAIPSTFILIIYFVIVRHLPAGSGPHPSFLDTYLNLISITWGGPPISLFAPYSIVAALIYGMLFLWITSSEVSLLLKDNKLVALYYLFTIIIAPILLTLVVQPEIILPRYFLSISLIFLALLAQHIYRTRNFIYLIIFLLGNIILNFNLARDQRGSYNNIIRYMLTYNDNPNHKLEILTDHNFRHEMMLNYYSPGRIKVVKNDDHLSNVPAWYLAHELDWFASHPATITLENKKLGTKEKYQLKLQSKSTPLSGWQNLLYKLKE